MADKQIGQLPRATSVTVTDLFVLEQIGTAKSVTGQTLISDLATALDGHGGIASFEKTSTSGLTDVYTLTTADGTTYTVNVVNGNGIVLLTWVDSGTSGDGMTHTGTFTYTDGTTSQVVISDGVKGDDGASWYVYLKYSGVMPTSDSDMSDVPDEYVGIYSGTSSTAPEHYTDYTWYDWKGDQGDAGMPITAVTRTGGDGSPGTDDTYTFYVGADAVGTAIIHNGADGIGTVNSINEIGVDTGTNNITLTASDVNAPTIPLHISVVSFSSFPKTITNADITSTMRVIDCVWGTPSAITSDVTWTTSDGSLVLSGSMSGSTTAEIVLIETTQGA